MEIGASTPRWGLAKTSEKKICRRSPISWPYIAILYVEPFSTTCQYLWTRTTRFRSISRARFEKKKFFKTSPTMSGPFLKFNAIHSFFFL